METPSPHRKKKWLTWLILLGLMLLVCAIWSGSWSWIDTHIAKGERGEFGDKFGAINSLFSGLAFAGVIFAIILQSQELELQREELQKSVEESTKQTQLFAQQLQAMQDSLRREQRRDIEAREPVFQWLRPSDARGGCAFVFCNSGAEVYKLKVECSGALGCIPSQIDVLTRGPERVFTFTIPGGIPFPPSFEFSVIYTTTANEARRQTFSVKGNGMPLPIFEDED